MTRPRGTPPTSPDTTDAPPLRRVLTQSEKATEKVEEAGVELSEVNDTLQVDVARGVPVVQVQQALAKSEAVEAKVQEAVQELVAVNDALAGEVAERDALEHRVRQGEAALSTSLAAEEAFRHRALHDALTGLPNGTLFLDRLEQALEQAERHTWRLAVLFLDLDGFKQVNDSHGHDVGDRVLQEVATRLAEAIRGADTVGRRGGDEFLVLALEMQEEASTIAFATTLGGLIGAPMDLDGVKVTVGTSIGVAIFPDDATTAVELLKAADLAMYRAKEGRLGVTRHSASTVSHQTPVPPRGVGNPVQSLIDENG